MFRRFGYESVEGRNPSCQFLDVFLFCGVASWIAYIFSLLELIPYQDIMEPKYFPASTPKVHLVGFSIILYCLNQYIIDVDLDRLANLILEDSID